MESEDNFFRKGGPRGKTTEELEEGVDSSSDEDDMIPIHENAQMEEELPKMDFEFYDPNENQARSIRNLINPYAMELKDLDTNEMANAIVTQNVGVMLGCPDDEEESKEQKNKGIYDKEIFAFVSVLNVGFYSTRTKFMPCIIKKWRELAASSGSSNAEKLLKLLEPGNLPKVCLMLAQRLLNVPSQLIPTLYEQFTEDLLWVAQNDKEESPKYNVDWVVYMVRGQKHFVKGAKGGNKKKQGGSPGGSYEFVCSKFEDEVFLKGAEYTVELGSTSTKQAAGGTVIEEPVPSVPVVKMICVLKAENVLALMKSIRMMLAS